MTETADRGSVDLRALLHARAAAALAGGAPTIPTRPDPSGPAPLSDAQARLWFLAQLDPDSAAYLLPVALRLRGELDGPALRQAIVDLVSRHEVLRSIIAEIDGRPMSTVLSPDSVPIATADLTESDIDRVIDAELRQPFDLGSEPPTRATLHLIAADDHLLVLTFHHIAVDDWSFPRVIADLDACYAARRDGGPLPEPPRLQHADVAVWAADRGDDGGEEWWAARLSGLAPVLELPVDRPRPPVADWASSTVDITVPAGLAERVRAVATDCGATPFMVFLAAWQALLARLCGTDDVVVGVPEAGRRHAGTEEVVGCFINTLPLRTEVSPELTGRELLRRARATALDAFSHADVSFERIVERIAPDRDRSTTPVFQVLLNVLDRVGDPLALCGVAVESLDLPAGTAKYDLNLALGASNDGGYTGGLTYRDDLFDRATIERIGGWFVTTLAGLVGGLDQSIGAISLDAVSGPLVSCPPPELRFPALLHELVEASADTLADQTAVVAKDGRLSYSELDVRANRIAHRLLAAGLRPDEPVAVLVDRTTWFPAGALGVLKASGAYLPVDPIFPDERVAGMLDSVDVRFVLAQGDLADRVAGTGREVWILDDPSTWDGQPATRPEVTVDPGQVAYVIFTSGSTGRPKGVGVEHRNITAYLAAAMERATDAVDGFDRRVFALVATIAADSGMTTTWGSLATGSVLHLLDREISTDPAAYADYFSANRVDVVKMVPSLLELLATYGDLAAVLPHRLLILGGEPCPWGLVNRIDAARPELTVQNHYGPTEATVSVLLCDTDTFPAAERGTIVPLGWPFPGVDCYVADERGRALPAGIAGELWIGGPLVARGYLGHPELTAARFTPDPVTGLDRCYRTGDRVRVLADGSVLFLGRVDDQVKIRGHRVELGEVTTALREHSDIAEAIALPYGEGAERRLAAWIVPAAGRTALVGPIRAALRKRLPDYMVPTAITVLPAFPLNPNGKIDRKALPEPADTREGRDRIEPAGPAETLVAAVWREVLGVPEVGATDDFFALGGHSFAATRVAGRLAAELGRPVPVRLLFDAPVLADLASVLPSADGAGPAPVIARRPDPGEPAPLSPAQRRLWFLTQLEPHSAAYNVPVHLRLTGPLDEGALLDAVRDLVSRHDVLHSRIEERDGEPVVVIDPVESVPMSTVDTTADLVEARLRVEAERPFALDVEPPLRVVLYRLAGDEHVLALTLHHCATDARTRDLLTGELGALYSARIGLGEPPAPPALQYADYAAWLADHDRDTAGLDWWTHQLAGLEPVLELPLDRPRPTVATWTGGTVPVSVPAPVAARVREVAARTGTTPFMVLLAAWQVLLARLSGSTDIAVGVPESGRHAPGTDAVVGCFVNTLVLRTDLGGDPTGRELLRRVRSIALDALGHADVPFEQVVDRVMPERDLAVTPIFQVALNLVTDSPERPRLPGLDVEPADPDSALVKFDLDLGLVDDGTTFTGGIAYRGELFDPDTVDRFADWYAALLAGLTEDLDRPLGAVELAPVSGPPLVGPPVTTPAEPVPALVERWAARTPAATAVVGPDGVLTYAELDERANRVAHRLRAAGVGADQRVALLIERSTDLAVGLLGALKAGAAYVALDPVYPDERIAAMLDLSDAAAVLTQAELRPRLPGGRPVLAVDDPAEWADQPADRPAITIDPESLAYAVFTSGSTGTPKAVAVEHRHLARYLDSVLDRLALGARPASFALVSTIAADLGLTMVWGALATGGTLHLVDREVATDPEAYAAYTARHGIDVVKMVPSQLALMAAHTELAGILPGRLLVLAGEACDRGLVEQVRAAAPGLAVQVHYGPSETTVAVFGCSVDELTERYVPLGTPFPGVEAYVVDPAGRPVPAGLPGELWIGGPTVARGYLGRDDLTAERFVAHPVAGRSRCYRTGDRVRIAADGTVTFLGRVDDQVKIRGYRVELGEVAAVLRERPEVEAAFVLPFGEAQSRKLAAWVTPSTVDAAAVRTALRERLPDYMVPVAIVALDALPLTPNGKVDRTALPAPETAPTTGAYVAPQTPTQQAVVAAYGQILGVERVGIDDDFFALGGDSFGAVRAVRLIDPQLRVIELFTHPTPRELAAVLDAGSTSDGKILQRLAGAANATLTVLCVPYGGGSSIAYQPLATELAAIIPGAAVLAVELPGHDPARPDEERISLDAVADRVVAEVHESVTGPVVVYGHCVGTALATELALRLEADGVPVEGLIVAGSFPTATLPGRLASWFNRRFPASRFMNDKASRDLLRSMGGLMEEDGADAATQRTVLSSMAHDVDNSQAWFTRELTRDDPRTLRAPALCVVGERDRGTDLYQERYAEWAAFAPQVGLAVVPRAGHYFLKHQAAELARLLAETVGGWRIGRRPEAVPHVSVCGPEARKSLRDFYVVAAGQTMSIMGSTLSLFALGLWVYKETGNLSTFALITFLALVPRVVVGPVGGALTDRLDRRKVMLGCEIAGAAAVIALITFAATGTLAVWNICLIVGVLALSTGVHDPTWIASTAQLVPKPYLAQANGIAQLGDSFGDIVAPLAGGALLLLIGLKGIIAIDVVSYVVGIGTLMAVRFPNRAYSRPEESFARTIAGGWRYMRRRKPLVAMAGFFLVDNFFGALAIVLTVPLVFAFDSAAAVGLVTGVAGVGGLVGSFLIMIWGGTRRRATGMVGTVCFVGFGLLVMGLHASILLVCIGVLVRNAATNVVNAHWRSLIQVKVHPELQGRVLAANQMMALAMTPVAYLSAPAIVGWVDPMLRRHGALANTFVGHVVGVGPGRGIGLVVVVCGAVLMVWGVLGLRYRPLRYMEDLLPDTPPGAVLAADADEAAAAADQELDQELDQGLATVGGRQ